MLTRNLLILVCCLAPSSALAAWGGVPANAEVIPTPANSALANPAPQAAAAAPCDTPCDDSCAPSKSPWWYWWHACHGREQHYGYLPPLPGWYYFRPYSVAQLRAQQRVVQEWGGDPRYPYSKLPEPANSVIQWPPVLLDSRFADPRTKIEAPYRGDLKGQAKPTAADYQGMIEAAGQMQLTLRKMTAETSTLDRLSAERFLDQLTAEARPYMLAEVRAQQKPAPQWAGDARGSHYGGESQQPFTEPVGTAVPPSTTTVVATGFDSIVPTARPPEAAIDIIKWPETLRDPRFADQRTKIEAPYRRGPKESAAPSAAEYQDMIETAEQMKAILKEITADMQDRLNADEFLDQLSAEAREQVEKAAAAHEQPVN